MREYLAMLLLVIVAVSVVNAADAVQAKKADAQCLGKLDTTTSLYCSSVNGNQPFSNQQYLISGRVTTPQCLNKPVPYQLVRIRILRYDAHSTSWTLYPGQPYIVTRTNGAGYFAISRTSYKPEVIRYCATLLGYPDNLHSQYITSTSGNQDVYVGPAGP